MVAATSRRSRPWMVRCDKLLDRCQRPVRLCRELDADRVTRADLAAGNHDAHDAGLADEVAVFVASQRRPHQPRPNAVKLGTRVAQTSNLDDRRAAEIESRAS